MPELEPMEIIETVCSVCQMPAVRVSGQWLHVDFGDAVFCKTIMRGEWDELEDDDA